MRTDSIRPLPKLYRRDALRRLVAASPRLSDHATRRRQIFFKVDADRGLTRVPVFPRRLRLQLGDLRAEVDASLQRLLACINLDRCGFFRLSAERTGSRAAAFHVSLWAPRRSAASSRAAHRVRRTRRASASAERSSGADHSSTKPFAVGRARGFARSPRPRTRSAVQRAGSSMQAAAGRRARASAQA